jgi:CBS domain-containing protein
VTTSLKVVGDLMTREVVTMQSHEDLFTADTTMHNGRMRHLPIVGRHGGLVGIVSHRDLYAGGLLRALGYGSLARQEALESVKLATVMKTILYTTTPDASIQEAAKIMLDHKVGCLPVLDGERLVGILTESDLVKLVSLQWRD